MPLSAKEMMEEIQEEQWMRTVDHWIRVQYDPDTIPSNMKQKALDNGDFGTPGAPLYAVVICIQHGAIRYGLCESDNDYNTLEPSDAEFYNVYEWYDFDFKDTSLSDKYKANPIGSEFLEDRRDSEDDLWDQELADEAYENYYSEHP